MSGYFTRSATQFEAAFEKAPGIDPQLITPGMTKHLASSYGLRLLPKLYAHLNPMPFEAAA